ncbi:sulfotransferase family 2 domain-containing protein [Formosa maritima]|nr:sulfotransferase family 2 domain-containing protein [Formosa maritima]
MSSKNIFIHIPKTGGTTINCVMNKTQWQTKPDFNYRHIIYETKRSNTKDIFNPINYDKYLEYNLFMLLRNPIDRIISEYYFIKDRTEFISLIKPVPRNLKEYIINNQTQNYMVGFLVGKRMYDEELVTEDDLDLVINTIKNLDINVGIFEEYSKSLLYFSTVTRMILPKEIEVKRITLNRPKVENIPNEIKELIEKNNVLDFKLYNYCLKKFNLKTQDLNNTKTLNFIGDKYNYVLKYTERFNLLEIGLKDKRFINNNQQFFNELNNYLHHTLKLKSGKNYVQLWNDCFINTFKITFPNSTISSLLGNLNVNEEPLYITEEICSILNKSLIGKTNSTYKKSLSFNKDFINFEKLNKNKGVISKLKSMLFD